MMVLLLACSTASIEDGATLGPFTQVKTSFTSAFAARTDGGVVLVDAGYQPDGGAIEDVLEDWGLGPQDVTDVFITHGHTDHTRGLLAWPDARIWAHEREADRVVEEGRDGAQVTDTLVDGQVVTVGELALEVLHVPGHTAGNVVYLADGVLLTGDTAMRYRDGTIGPAPDRYHDDIEVLGFAHTAPTTDLDAFWSM